MEHLKGERNYHVFYMVCKGKDVIDESTKLAKWEDFKICKQARHARSPRAQMVLWRVGVLSVGVHTLPAARVEVAWLREALRAFTGCVFLV